MVRHARLQVLLLCALLTLTACAGEAPYTNPPAPPSVGDLAGTWEAHYPCGIDTLVLSETGMFRQTFRDRQGGEHSYTTDSMRSAPAPASWSCCT